MHFCIENLFDYLPLFYTFPHSKRIWRMLTSLLSSWKACLLSIVSLAKGVISCNGLIQLDSQFQKSSIYSVQSCTMSRSILKGKGELYLLDLKSQFLYRYQPVVSSLHVGCTRIAGNRHQGIYIDQSTYIGSSLTLVVDKASSIYGLILPFNKFSSC